MGAAHFIIHFIRISIIINHPVIGIPPFMECSHSWFLYHFLLGCSLLNQPAIGVSPCRPENPLGHPEPKAGGPSNASTWGHLSPQAETGISSAEAFFQDKPRGFMQKWCYDYVPSRGQVWPAGLGFGFIKDLSRARLKWIMKTKYFWRGKTEV